MKVLLYQFHLKKTGLTFATNRKNLGADYGDYWKLSVQSCKEYAKKHNFDYKLVSPTEEEWEPWFVPEPQFEQFRAIEFLKEYDAVLYVDTDVLIKPSCPNIVEKYKKDGTNIVLSTGIGTALLNKKRGAVGAYQTGVVIWYNKSLNTESLRDLKPIDYAYNGSHFALGDFIESRRDLHWWERWEDFKPFMGKFRSGMLNDEKFFGFIINITDSSFIKYPNISSPALSHISIPPGESHEVIIPFSTHIAGNTYWWGIEEDMLGVGIYEVEAGPRGYSDKFPWGKATFYVVE